MQEKQNKSLKALVFSDLHLKFNRTSNFHIVIPDDVNIIIVAGDVTDPASESIYWLQENIASPNCPVIFVAGNHEHYGQIYEESMELGRVAASKCKDVHFLENNEIVLNGVRFLGCTLWTDHKLYGNVEESSKYALLRLNDYRLIHTAKNPHEIARWTPEQTSQIHEDSIHWLENRLKEKFDGKTVVLTHHCPHPLSIATEYLGDKLNPAFTSDLSTLITTYQPDFWFHGHTHANFDYIVPNTKTRIICNPRGYIRRGTNEVENPHFKDNLTIEI